MERAAIPEDVTGYRVYFVGIKGTGMAALAELFHGRGAVVSGSDTAERFYTDEVLTALGIPYLEGFAPENLPRGTQLLIHSAAYERGSHPEILRALERGVPVLEYTEALGELSKTVFSVGVAGVHGKTTTTAMIGTICRETGVPAYVLAGSAVSTFGGRSTFVGGDSCFIAETCEYRRHFLSFRPDAVVVTNVDADHLDYFRDREDVMDAFTEYVMKLPQGGSLIYCADDEGAAALAEGIRVKRPDISRIPYGFTAEGPYRIGSYSMEPGVHRFTLGARNGEDEPAGGSAPGGNGTDGPAQERGMPLELHIPGRHSVLNAAASVATVRLIRNRVEGAAGDALLTEGIKKGLSEFAGSKRRSEILGESAGVVFADDYGHHPEEIVRTIEGFREFYPDRRLIVDFMSHTYTRTAAFLQRFAEAFGGADEVILHKIYASAREQRGEIDGRRLYREVSSRHPRVGYFHEVMDARDHLRGHLKPGDLFLTMGAGDNWRLGERLLRDFREEEGR